MFTLEHLKSFKLINLNIPTFKVRGNATTLLSVIEGILPALEALGHCKVFICNLLVYRTDLILDVHVDFHFLTNLFEKALAEEGFMMKHGQILFFKSWPMCFA